MRAHRLLLAAAALAASTAALAQAPAAPESELGTARTYVDNYSSDYRALVTAAMPKVDAATVASYVDRARREGAAARALTIPDGRSWAAMFGLKVDPERAAAARPGEIVEVSGGAYSADPETGRFFVAVAVPGAAPIPRPQFLRQLTQIRAAHVALAKRIGIPDGEVFFFDFRETLAQSTPAPGLEDAVESAIESAGASTSFLRMVGGLMVDGSFATLSSTDEKHVEMVQVSWPRIRMMPEVQTRRILAPVRLTERVVNRITESSKGEAVNVLMAVVLRPVEANHRVYYVPSLRVGVRPKPVKREDGYLTNAGEEFYYDLIVGMEDLPDLDDRDLVPQNQEREEDPAPKG